MYSNHYFWSKNLYKPQQKTEALTRAILQNIYPHCKHLQCLQWNCSKKTALWVKVQLLECNRLTIFSLFKSDYLTAIITAIWMHNAQTRVCLIRSCALALALCFEIRAAVNRMKYWRLNKRVYGRKDRQIFQIKFYLG